MTVTELQEELSLVRACLKKLREGHQSWSVGNKSFTMVDYAALERTERRLSRELYIAQNGGSFGCSTAVIGGRR